MSDDRLEDERARVVLCPTAAAKVVREARRWMRSPGSPGKALMAAIRDFDHETGRCVDVGRDGGFNPEAPRALDDKGET